MKVKQLVLVAMVAAVFGGGAGYLGANLQARWITRNVQASTPTQTAISQQDGSIEDRVKRLEQAVGRYVLDGIVRMEAGESVDWRIRRSNLDARLRDLEDKFEPQPGRGSGLESRVERLECLAGGGGFC